MRKILAFLTLAVGLSGCAMLDFVSGPPAVFVVFFPDHSTVLTPDGQKIVGDVAAAAHLSPGKIVQLTGPSTKIAPGYDPSLAEPRIHAVELALDADGISPGRMVRSSETTDDVNVTHDPSGAQRVEIRLVDPAAAH